MGSEGPKIPFTDWVEAFKYDAIEPPVNLVKALAHAAIAGGVRVFGISSRNGGGQS